MEHSLELEQSAKESERRPARKLLLSPSITLSLLSPVQYPHHCSPSVIQLPRYLNRVTCSKGTLFSVIHRCIPFGFAVPFIIITFVFFTLISIPYALHVLFSLSTIFCIFFLLSDTNTASSAYLRSVILTPLNLIPSIFSMASFIINSLYRLKSIGDITQPCLTPFSTSTSLLISPSHLTTACCLQ